MLGHPAFIPMGQDPFAKALDATPTPGWFSAMPVAIDDAFTEGTGNSLFRIARDAFDMSPPMSAEEANAKYGHSGMQFYGPVQEETALRRYRAKLEERDRKAFLERADLGFASNLTAGLLSSLFDPAEMAINIGIALTATPAASGARIAGQAGMRASLMSGVARGAMEGAAGAAISEIPIGIASNLYQFDHTYADALFSIGGGAILGGFFGGLGGALSYRYRPRADQETHTAATQLAVAQAMSGQKPDVTPALGGSPPLEVRFSLRDDPYYQSAIARVGTTDIAEAIRSGDQGNIERSAANPQTVEKAARTIAEYDGMAGASDAPLEEVLGFLRAEYGADVEPKTLERRFAKILEDQRSSGMAEPPPADITARADEPARAQEPEPEPEASAEPPAPPAEPPKAGLFDAIDDILRRIAPFAKREYLDRIDPRRFGRAQEAAQAHLGKPVTEEDLAGLEVDGVAYIRAGDVIVELAKRVIGGDPDAIARHEAIHALRLAGLFTDAEWNTLLHWAQKDWARRYGKTTDDLGLEEAIADAFSDWAKGNLVIQSEKPRTIMGRIRDFWAGVVDRLGGELSPRDIFDAVERGKIGRRGLGKEGSFGFEARRRAAMAAVGRTETYATEGVQDPDPAPPSRAAEGQDNADPSPAVEEINEITESLRADLDAGLISQQEFDEAMQAMQAATTRPAEMRKAMTEAVACELS